MESIIKSGRALAESGGVAEPAELTKQVDALKQMYNTLGARVTDNKARLETALVAARDLQADRSALQTWLDNLDPNIARQTLELEMSRMQSTRDKMNENYDEFVKTCDPVHLESLKVEVDSINERWDHLKKHGFVKKESEIESLQRFLNTVEQELEREGASAERARELEGQVRGRGGEVQALDNKALTKQWQRALDRLKVSANRVTCRTL